MEYVEIRPEDLDELWRLQIAYKAEIGEAAPTEEGRRALLDAVAEQRIYFYGCRQDGMLAACCSVSKLFSTFDYSVGGVFEDFYIMPEYRHRGIAGKLVRFAYECSGVSTLTVGCAECDIPMYSAIGFGIKLGNMLAFGE